MKRLLNICVLALVSLIVCNNAYAVSYTLFSNGKSVYDIVIRNNASATERNAAVELQKYISEISGAELKIKNTVAENTKHIFIGFSPNGRALNFGERKLGEKDNYSCVAKGGNIYLYGNNERSTMYSVFGFLEDFLGVRWYAADVTKIPKRRKYSFSDFSQSFSPAIPIRFVVYKEAENNEWCAHNKVNGNYNRKDLGGSDSYWSCHTAGLFMPAEKYFTRHPEYFAMIDGKRIKDGQPCLANPDVFKIMLGNLLDSISKYPDYAIYDMSQKDNQIYCTCPKCSALAKRYGAQSGVWIWFVNKVAKEIKKKYPNKFVGTFAYQYTRTPPVGIVPDDNVVIRLCSIECCFMHSLEGCSQDCNKLFLQDITNWAKTAKHLYIWDYAVSFSQYLAPFPNFYVLAPNIRTFQRNNAIGVLEEAQYQTKFGEFSELRSYVLAKLLWNPSLDVNVLVREFVNAFYGGAASHVMRYFSSMQNLVGGNTHSGIYPKPDDALYNDRFISESMSLLSEAKKHCHNNKELGRVERLWLSPAYLYIMRNKKNAQQNGVYKEWLGIVKRDGIRINERQTTEQFNAEYYE